MTRWGHFESALADGHRHRCAGRRWPATGSGLAAGAARPVGTTPRGEPDDVARAKQEAAGRRPRGAVALDLPGPLAGGRRVAGAGPVRRRRGS